MVTPVCVPCSGPSSVGSPDVSTSVAPGDHRDGSVARSGDPALSGVRPVGLVTWVSPGVGTATDEVGVRGADGAEKAGVVVYVGGVVTPAVWPFPVDAVSGIGAATIESPSTASGVDESSVCWKAKPATGANTDGCWPGKNPFSPRAVATMMPPHRIATMQNTKNGAR